MTTSVSPAPPITRSRGRPLYWLGVAIVILGLAAYFVQFLALKILVTPWYMPGLATLGVILLGIAAVQRPGFLRIGSLVVVLLLAGAEWFFVGWMTLLPAYAGPGKGEHFESFSIARANGSSQFTDENLSDGTPTVLVFYRGHW